LYEAVNAFFKEGDGVMRRNIFYRISLIRLLIASYILLVIFVFFLGYEEYSRTQNGDIHIKTVSSYSSMFLLLILAFTIANAIREIKDTNKVLAQTKDNYRRFVQNTGEIIIRSDGYGRILFVNRAFKEKLGYCDDEIRELNITDLFAEETKSTYGGNSIFFRHDEQITSINVIYKTKSGRKIYLDGNVVLNYKDGRLETTESFLRDITHRRELHDELMASENKYRALFDLSPLPEYFVDTTTLEFVEVNPAAVKKYGFSRAEFLKMTIYDLRRLEGEEKERFHSWFTLFTRGDSAYEGKTTHYKRNGQAIDVELRFKSIELKNRKMLLVIAIDVTKKEKNEREINQAILNAQENERQEIGTELHDNICQILASSQLLLDFAKRSGSLESNKLIDRSKKNIALALNEIRNLSHRMAPIFLEVSSFEGAISDLLLNMNPDDRYEIQFEFDRKITSELVSSDIQLNLYRILQEQLKNIVKYANATGIKVGLSLDNYVIRMYIIDNGVGFDIGKVKKGIGLVNIQRRAELFWGKFSIDTSPGKGCRLFIELPVPANDLNKN
jgi:PAS domain S-box-containing protein